MFEKFRHAKLFVAVTALIMLAIGAAVWEARADAEKQPVVKPSPLLEPAMQAYKGVAAAKGVGNATSAELYFWSHRWMEADVASAETADRQQQAKVEHLNRMNLHFQGIEMLHKQGVAGGEAYKYQAAKYYLEEAKILAQQ